MEVEAKDKNLEFCFKSLFRSIDQIQNVRDNFITEVVKITRMKEEILKDLSETGDFKVPKALLYKQYYSIPQVFGTLGGMMGGVSRRYTMSLIMIALQEFKRVNIESTGEFSVLAWQSLSHEIFGQSVSRLSLLDLVEERSKNPWLSRRITVNGKKVESYIQHLVKKNENDVEIVRIQFNSFKQDYKELVNELTRDINEQIRDFLQLKNNQPLEGRCI